jgi:glycosyltransferase involved in cell wall biosynthesis
MLQGARIAVIVPAYNESRLIARTLASVPSYVDHVVVVDDGSRDDTAARAQGHGDDRVEVLRHGANRGVGRTLATGYEAAFAQGADVAVVMAGDGQMDPRDLKRLLAPVLRGETDYAKGDRLGYPEANAHMPWTRWVGNHLLSWLTRWATGLEVRDSQCGYTALSRRAAERVALDRIWPRYGYPNDLLGALADSGMRVRDVIVRPVYGDEDSGIGWWHALVVIPFVLLRVGLRRTRRSAPALPRTWPEAPRRLER